MSEASPGEHLPIPGISAALCAVFRRHQRRGMIGGSLDDHVIHALGFAAAWPVETPPTSVVDLGSGGGLPALVLAEIWPESSLVLTETRQKRADALERAVRSLRLSDRVTVWSGDVQDAVAAGHTGVDLVTARSFASPSLTAECGAMCVRPGGTVIVSEPPQPSSGADDEGSRDRWPAAALADLGLTATWREVADHRYVVMRRVSDASALEARTRRQMERHPRW